MLQNFHLEQTESLLKLMKAAILNIDDNLYSPVQKQAWLSGVYAKTTAEWQQYFIKQKTWVYCLKSQPVGLLSAKKDYLDLLYIAPRFQGLGFGKVLLQHFLQNSEYQIITAHASLAALLFFRSQHFTSCGLYFTHRENIKLPYHHVLFQK